MGFLNLFLFNQNIRYLTSKKMDINYHQLSRIYIYIKKQNFDKNNVSLRESASFMNKR